LNGEFLKQFKMGEELNNFLAELHESMSTQSELLDTKKIR